MQTEVETLHHYIHNHISRFVSGIEMVLNCLLLYLFIHIRLKTIAFLCVCLQPKAISSLARCSAGLVSTVAFHVIERYTAFDNRAGCTRHVILNASFYAIIITAYSFSSQAATWRTCWISKEGLPSLRSSSSSSCSLIFNSSEHFMKLYSYYVSV